MINYNYLVDNFISLTTDKKTIKIFDKYGVFKYAFNPAISYYFYKNNYVYIKVENDDDITLDFETNAQAIEALEKLNSVKKLVISNITSDIDYYTQTELDNGILDTRYYTTSAITNILSNYLTTAATFAISDASDVLLSGITNGEVLVYDNGVWINSSFTFDMSAFTSDYYTIYELSSSTSGVYINWNNIINTPSGASGYGIEQDIYNILSANTYTKTELYPGGTTGSGVLDDRYYVKTQTYKIIEINNLLDDKTDLVDFYSHTGNTNNPHETTFYNLESTAHTHLISDVDNLQTTLNNKAELFDFQTHTGQTNPHLTSFNDLTLTSHTHLISDVDNLQTTLNDKAELFDFQIHTGQTNPHLTRFNDLVLTAHTHLWSELSNSSHTHDDRYYTEIELNPTGDATGSGELDVRYYTKIQTYEKLEIDDMFNGYYNSGETNDLLLNYYTSAQTDTLLEQFSITSHTHTLDELSGVTITAPQNNNFLIYSSGEWVNSAVSFDVSNFYTKTELDNGQLNNIYIPLVGTTGITGDLIPATDGIYSLGSATRQWKELHVSGGTIYIDGIPVTTINGDLYVNGELIPTSAIIASNYSTTSHTHDNRYYTETELLTGTTGTNVLDSRYYVKTQTYDSNQINNLFNQYYTSAQTDLIFLDYYTSAQTDTLLLNYYTSNETDLLLTQYAFTSHTHNLEDLSNIFISGVTNGQILAYSAGTWKNIDSTDLQSDLSGYYTSAQTNTLLLGKSDTGHTHNFNDLTLTSHTHLWTDISNSSHTHDDRYYTQLLLNPGGTTGTGVLDDRYYVKTQTYTNVEVNALLNQYYTSAQTDTILNEYYNSGETKALFDDYYTSAQTDSLLNQYSLTSHTHNLSDLTLTSHTHLWTDITNSSHTHDDRYYTESEIDNLLILSSTGLTAHINLTGTTNPHQIGFNDLTLTSHTHDDRYYTEFELLTGTTGTNVLDSRYYTKLQTYDIIQMNLLYYTSAQTDTILNNYIISSQTYNLDDLIDVNITTPIQDNILVYSGGSWVNSTLADVNIDLSAYYTSAQTDTLLNEYYNSGETEALFNGYYTSAQTDTLLLGKSDTGHTHNFNDLTLTSHTHLWSDITNSSHTHDDRYYTETEIDSNFYTKIQTYNSIEVDTLFNDYYTSAQTDTLLLDYYTSAQTDTLLLSKSDTGHTHAISTLSDVIISGETYGDVLVYDGAGSWINSAVTLDLSNYYTSSEVDNILSSITYATGATILNELQDVTITSAIPGEILVFDVLTNTWINSGISFDLSAYYTSSQTDSIFFTSAQTNALYSLTSHTHVLTDLSDVNSGATDGQFLQYSGSSWIPVSSIDLSGSYLSVSGGTLYGDLLFDFMTGTTDRILHVNSGGTVTEGEEIISLYITDSTVINAIIDPLNWSGSTFDSGLTAITSLIEEGQKYIDQDYFYEYFDGILFRSYYALYDHNHDSVYYTQSQLNPSGLTGVLDYRYLSVTALSGFSLYSLSDTNISVTPGEWDFLKYDVSGWTNYYIDLTGLSYKNEVVSTGTTVTGISGLTGGGTLNNNIQIEHLTANTRATVATTTPATTTVLQSINWDQYGHVNNYVTTDLNSIIVRSLTNLTDVDITSVADEQYLRYNAGTAKWVNDTLTKSKITDFSDSNYVHTTGNEMISGYKVFTDDLVCTNLTVNGTQTIINTQNLAIKDNVIIINSGETSSGVTLLEAGIQIDRGIYPDYYLLYSEYPTYSGGSFKIGIYDDLKSVTTINNQINNAIPYWVATPVFGYFETSTAFTWDSSTLNIDGNLIVTGLICGTTSIDDATDTQVLYMNGNIITGSSNLTFDGTDFNIIGYTTTDDLYVINVLTVSGRSYFNHNIQAFKDINLTENLYVSGVSNFYDDVFLSEDLIVSGNSYFYDDIFVSGNSYFYDDIFVSGNSYFYDDINLTENLYVSGVSNFYDDIFLSEDLIVSGNSHFNQNVNITQTLNVSGNSYLNQTLNVSGNSYLSEDLIVSGNSYLKQSLNVSGNSYFNQNVNIDQTLNVSGNSYFYDDIFVSANTFVSGNSYFYDDVNLNANLIINSGYIEGDLIPNSDGTRSLGSTTYQWKDLWVSGGTIYLERIPLTTDGNTLLFSGYSYYNSNDIDLLISGFTIGGSNDMIQFNSGNLFSGSSNFLWNDTNKSLINGENCAATGTFSYAQGSYCIASGDYSYAHGSGCTAIGIQSHAEGVNTIAGGGGGGHNHAEGSTTLAYATGSHAEGYNTQTYGSHSHAEGGSSIAYASGSHAEGYSAMTYGNFSHAEGQSTEASGTSSHSEGFHTISSGQHSHAEGVWSISYGGSSHAEGYSAMTYGNYSHAEGGSTETYGEYSHAEGAYSVAYATSSHAEGSHTITYGLRSHSEGYYTETWGNQAHAEGAYTVASGDSSHAGGLGENVLNKIIADGIASFNHSFRNNATPDVSGATADYSVILGGKNNSVTHIGSAIIGGDTIVSKATYTTYVSKIEIDEQIDTAFIIKDVVDGTRYKIYISGGTLLYGAV